MLQTLQNIFLALVLFYSMTSCQENGNIGDFYGQWQLQEIQTPEGNNTYNKSFLAFQTNVVFARILTDAHYADAVEGVWQQMGDSIRLSFYTGNSLHTTDLQDETARENVIRYLEKDFGMEGEPENLRFAIEQLDGNRLILSRDKKYFWHFRKF